MTTYIAKRLLLLVPILLGVSLTTFALLRLTPGDPATAILGVQATPDEVARIRRALGLDRPWYVQYGLWLAVSSRLRSALSNVQARLTPFGSKGALQNAQHGKVVEGASFISVGLHGNAGKRSGRFLIRLLERLPGVFGYPFIRRRRCCLIPSENLLFRYKRGTTEF